MCFRSDTRERLRYFEILNSQCQYGRQPPQSTLEVPFPMQVGKRRKGSAAFLVLSRRQDPTKEAPAWQEFCSHSCLPLQVPGSQTWQPRAFHHAQHEPPKSE